MVATTVKSNNKKIIISTVAVKVFAERGYHGSRITDIITKANIAYGLFYHYFSSKEDVLIYIYQNAWKSLLDYMERIFNEIVEPGETLKYIITFIFKSFIKDHDLMKVLIMDVPRSERFYSEENQKLYNDFFLFLSGVIEKGKVTGAIKSSINPDFAAIMIHGSIDAIVRHYLYNEAFKSRTLPVNDAIDQVLGIVSTWFNK